MLYSAPIYGTNQFCLLKIWVHSGFTLGLLAVYFGLTWKLLLWSTVRTEVWSRPVFIFIILLPVIPALCVFQIHSVCFHGYTCYQGLLSVFTLGLPWVYSGSTIVSTEIKPRVRWDLLSVWFGQIGIERGLQFFAM